MFTVPKRYKMSRLFSFPICDKIVILCRYMTRKMVIPFQVEGIPLEIVPVDDMWGTFAPGRTPTYRCTEITNGKN